MVANYGKSLAVKEESKLRNYLPLNLQFFADDGGGNDGSSDSNADGGDQDSSQKGDGDSGNTDSDNNTSGTGDNNNSTDSANNDKSKDKTFTQADVSNIAAREAKKAREKILKQLGVKDIKGARSALQQYQEHLDSQKTEAEKVAERAKQLEEANGDLTNQVTTLEAQVAALKADVDPESLDDVIVLAKAKVSDDVSIDEAMKDVVEKYPHFKKQAQQQDNDSKKKKPKFTAGDHKDDSKQTEKDSWINAFKNIGQ